MFILAYMHTYFYVHMYAYKHECLHTYMCITLALQSCTSALSTEVSEWRGEAEAVLSVKFDRAVGWIVLQIRWKIRV